MLLKQTFKQGGSEVIKIGDETIPYHADFRLYLTTKLPNPHYSPENSVKVTLLNFTVTASGLEDQLLGTLVSKERPDLQEMKNALVISNAEMKRELKDIEDTILKMLAESEGNILDDETLIHTLAQSKKTSEEINIKVAEAETTEKEIDTTREGYRPVAFHGSLLFFCVSDLVNADPMYQYSLQWFIDLYSRGIDDAQPNDDLDIRLESLKDFFTYSLYKNVCRSLFERHKLLFAFILCLKILQGRDEIPAAELRFLLAGPSSNSNDEPNPAPHWLVEKAWCDIVSLTALPAFDGLHEHFSVNIQRWAEIFDDNAPHRAKLPAPWQQKLTSLERILLMRCIRLDKVVENIQDFVEEKIGKKFIEPPPFDLTGSYQDSAPSIPLLFVLSAGADPITDLMRMAEDHGMNKKLDSISLGQGQGPIANKLIGEGVAKGRWVLLQNCHLSTSYMPKLESIVEQWVPDQLHPEFRLWLTSMPSKSFPVLVLQNAVKMTMEPPGGLRANLIGSYQAFDDAFLAGTNKPESFRKLLFGLSMFHAVIQERRRFGPLGWNIMYEWTTQDYYCTYIQFRKFLDKYEQVPFKVMTFLTGQINYAGRVTDDKDRLTLNTLLADFINEEILQDDYKFSPSGTLML